MKKPRKQLDKIELGRRISAGKQRASYLTLSTTTAAYVAGLFDGDGSITITYYPRKNGRLIWAIHGTISSSAENGFLHELHLACGQPGSITVRAHDPGQRPKYAWIMAGRALEWFLLSVQPWLRLKKPHAEIALEYLSLTSGGSAKKLTSADHAQRKLLQLQLQQLHLTTGAHSASRWGHSGKAAKSRADRIDSDSAAVSRWAALPISRRNTIRAWWRAHNVALPFYAEVDDRYLAERLIRSAA